MSTAATSQHLMPDAHWARDLVHGFDPLAQVRVHLDAVSGGRSLLDRELRWRALAHRLRLLTAPEPAVLALEERVLSAPVAPAMLMCFADVRGRIRAERIVRASDVGDDSAFACPPGIRPLLRAHQELPPHVLAVVDRSGADVEIWDAVGESPVSYTVVGPDDEIRQTAASGWAGLEQGRRAHRAVDSWRHNAAAIATRVAEQMYASRAPVLVLSGEQREARLVEERLPANHPWAVVHVPGGRAPDGSQRRRPAEVIRALHRHAAHETADLLAELHRSDLGIEGRSATLDALRQDRVAVLLVAETSVDAERAWFGRTGTEIYATEPDALQTRAPVRAADAADVAVRSALLCGARVRVTDAHTPGMPSDGLAALCRF